MRYRGPAVRSCRTKKVYEENGVKILKGLTSEQHLCEQNFYFLLRVSSD